MLRFDRWCQKFNDLLRNKAQKREFRNYLGGLLGESERKNIYQMASDSVGVTYHKLHHFLTEATWSAGQINERRLEVMNKCNQTRISRGFSLIIDDSGHRKSFFQDFHALDKVQKTWVSKSGMLPKYIS